MGLSASIVDVVNAQGLLDREPLGTFRLWHFLRLPLEPRSPETHWAIHRFRKPSTPALQIDESTPNGSNMCRAIEFADMGHLFC